MSWNKFLLGFLMVVLLTYAKSRLTRYWVPIEFSFFLIFLVIRSSGIKRALIMTFTLSLGLDLILQTAQVKGLTGLGQLFLVYLVINLKRFILPVYEDLFLIVSFAIFYIANYYISWSLSELLGVYFQTIRPINLIFFALFHTVMFGLVLVVLIRFRRGPA